MSNALDASFQIKPVALVDPLLPLTPRRELQLQLAVELLHGPLAEEPQAHEEYVADGDVQDGHHVYRRTRAVANGVHVQPGTALAIPACHEGVARAVHALL